MDDMLSQAEADATSVQEMEQLIGSMPELTGVPTVSDAVKQPMVSLSNPPPVPRGIRQGGKGRP
jgi:hypothetical protein